MSGALARSRRDLGRALVILSCALYVLSARAAQAGPTARVLRVDPEPLLDAGDPVLTTLVDVVDQKRSTDVLTLCAGLSDDARYDCTKRELEAPRALYVPLTPSVDTIRLSVRVDGIDTPLTATSARRFGDAHAEPRMGTAWLVVLDADSRMGAAYDDASAVVRRLIDSMGPSDFIHLVLLGEQQAIVSSGWLDAGSRQSTLSLLEKHSSPSRGAGRTRPLLSLLQAATREALVGISGVPRQKQPLHQALVVISSGYGGGDPSTTGPGATQFSSTLTSGRLDPDNSALPKLPVPIVSVFVPPKGLPEHRQLAEDFMRSLANTSIGGMFSVLRDGQGEGAGRLVEAIRSRFADYWVVRFRASCLAPSATQTFTLSFPGHAPPILPDASFKDVPIGLDPRDWPLDLDIDLTRKKARETGGVYPGGKLRVFGSFCWGNDASRPAIYFLPPGERLGDEVLVSAARADQVEKRLTSLDMRGHALASSSSFVEFEVPSSEQVLHGSGERGVVRFVIVDAKSKRSSGLSEATVLELPGRKPPLPLTTIVLFTSAGFFGAVALFVLIRSAFRGPNSSGTKARVPESPYATPAPVTRVPRRETGGVLRATLEGPLGRFTVLPDLELRVGRDGTRCAAVLTSPAISSHHATFRFEGERLLVRDESSGTGVKLGEVTIPRGSWMEVVDGTIVWFGSEKLRVTVTRG